MGDPDAGPMVSVVLPWEDWALICCALEAASRPPLDSLPRRVALHWVGVIYAARREQHPPPESEARREQLAAARAAFVADPEARARMAATKRRRAAAPGTGRSPVPGAGR